MPHLPFSWQGDLVARLTVDATVLQTTLADFIGMRGFRSMLEVVGALAFISLQQPLLALVAFAITPLLSTLLRAIVVRSSAIIYRRQQVRTGRGGCACVGGACRRREWFRAAVRLCRLTGQPK